MSVGPTEKVPDPLSRENRGESWKQFRREWKFYEIANKISKEEDEVQLAALMYVQCTFCRRISTTQRTACEYASQCTTESSTVSA